MCAANQNWVYYFTDTKQLWRVPLDGSGKPEPIPGSSVAGGFLTGRGMGISPDGKTLVYGIEMVNPDAATGTHRIALLDVATLSSPRFLEANPRISKGVQFTADGKAVACPVAENGVDNVWLQPISLGVTVTSPDRAHSVSDLLHEADVSMYAAKKNGRNRVELFSARQKGAAPR